MRRLLPLMIAIVLGLSFASTAFADDTFYVGLFSPVGNGSRSNTDVLKNLPSNLSFSGIVVGSDALFKVGEHVEIGIGVGAYYGSATQSGFTDRFFNFPFTGTVRYLPLAEDAPIHPYVGGGIGANMALFLADVPAVAGGSLSDIAFAFGPVVLGGVRIPLGDSNIALGGEIRWQGGTGSFSGDFKNSEINVGGINAVATVTFGR